MKINVYIIWHWVTQRSTTVTYMYASAKIVTSKELRRKRIQKKIYNMYMTIDLEVNFA